MEAVDFEGDLESEVDDRKSGSRMSCADVFTCLRCGGVLLTEGAREAWWNRNYHNGGELSATHPFSPSVIVDRCGGLGCCASRSSGCHADAWMTQPMGNALYATDCYAWRTYGNNDPNKAIQQALNDCNGANLVVDGVYGALTDAAIRSVQSSRGITVDGRYGPQTRDYMKWSTLTTQGYTSCWSRY
jgi:hypothetical protein